jgi:hypothetical protein
MKALMDFIFYRAVGDLALVVMSGRSDGKCGTNRRESAREVHV